MANLYSDRFGADMDAIRRQVRRSTYAQYARTMLVAAGLCAFGVVAVAATLLTNLI